MELTVLQINWAHIDKIEAEPNVYVPRIARYTFNSYLPPKPYRKTYNTWRRIW